MAIRILLALCFVALALGVDSALADRPTECAEEDKVSAGSRLDRQACKWDLNLSEITHVELIVEEVEHDNAPYCQLVFKFYGVNYERDFKPVVDDNTGGIRDYSAYDSDWNVRFQEYRQGDQPKWSGWSGGHYWDYYFSGGNADYIDIRSRKRYPVSEVVVVPALAGTVEYTLMQISLGEPYHVSSASNNYIDRTSPELPTPPNIARSSWGAQMNACLDNVQSRLDSESEMRRIEEERVAQESRLKADAAIAERKAAEEAAAAEAEAEAVRIQAESDAKIDAIKLESATELERTARETELARTQALKASFERKEAIDAVLANIIRIRLVGIEERRALTKTFLEAQVKASDEFKEEVAEFESRIAEYDRLNGLLLDHLENHRELMGRKIEEAQAAEEEQRRRLDDLFKVPDGDATPTPQGSSLRLSP